MYFLLKNCHPSPCLSIRIGDNLDKSGRDPALGPSVITAAATDSIGFFIFAGLASVFLL